MGSVETGRVAVLIRGRSAPPGPTTSPLFSLLVGPNPDSNLPLPPNENPICQVGRLIHLSLDVGSLFKSLSLGESFSPWIVDLIRMMNPRR